MSSSCSANLLRPSFLEGENDGVEERVVALRRVFSHCINALYVPFPRVAQARCYYHDVLLQ